MRFCSFNGIVSNENDFFSFVNFRRRPITTTTTESPLSLKDTTALYVSLMKSKKSPGQYEEYHDSEETTADPSHDDEDVESDEDHTHGASDELEGHTDASMDERHGVEEEEIPVEQKLRQLTDTISHLDKVSSSNDNDNRQSFLSLSDLIKTLRPDDNKPIQTDSSYSRSQVLGEMPEIVFNPRKTSDNRSLFK